MRQYFLKPGEKVRKSALPEWSMIEERNMHPRVGNKYSVLRHATGVVLVAPWRLHVPRSYGVEIL
jgi:hypothetical protein